MIPITWSFTVWGLDLLIAIDKFTKWVEAKPLAKIGSKQAVDFI
jgi:hypothetical protein